MVGKSGRTTKVCKVQETVLKGGDGSFRMSNYLNVTFIMERLRKKIVEILTQ